MSLEPVTEARSLHTVVHFQAEARALASHTADDLGYWEGLEAARLACTAHGGRKLHWNRVCNGMWEARGTAHRYQIVLILGHLA
ncbi:hypothetical protein [Deinococcus sp.]|uniref:hypothetical protein n=1 Tax=Deinococcus sp. TaxID=47478 RepID=UPI00286E603B|nr:hypothetical protein [Deinococcus sp.]